MKGLLRKDWYIFLKYGKMFAVFIVLYAFVAGFSKNALFYASFSVVMGALQVKMIMAYEEQDKWDCLAVCLPLKPEQLVREKYLASLVSTGAVAFLVGASICCAKQISAVGNDFFSPVPAFLMLLFMGSLISAVELPILFRFGVNRGRILLTLVVMLVTGILASTMAGLREITEAGGALFGSVSVPAAALIAGAVAVAVIGLAISMRISVTVYKKREF